MARPRQVSDQQILEAMRSAVLLHGPAVPLESVASALGVTAPALLKRFGSRQELLLRALLPPERPEWVEVLDRGPSDEPLEAQMRAVFGRISAFMTDIVPRITALRESGIAGHQCFGPHRGPEVGLRALQRWLAAARARGLVTASETESAAYAMLGALQMRAFVAHVGRRALTPSGERKYVADLAALFARTLTPAGASPKPRPGRRDPTPTSRKPDEPNAPGPRGRSPRSRLQEGASR